MSHLERLNGRNEGRSDNEHNVEAVGAECIVPSVDSDDQNIKMERTFSVMLSSKLSAPALRTCGELIMSNRRCSNSGRRLGII